MPTEAQVLRLIDKIPRRYKAVAWLGAGQAYRLGEALGIEGRCIDRTNEELNVVQQLRYSPKEHGGFYICEPKAGSSGTIDLDSVVAEMLADHANLCPPLEIELPDITSGDPVQRAAQLMISTTRGNPFTDRTWSREWAGWRDAAGWPKHGTFHSLRHFCATTHITNHADPKDVQRLLRHKSWGSRWRSTCTGGHAASVSGA